MPRFSSRDARALAEAVRLLDDLPERPRSVVPEFLKSLRSLLGAEQAIAYSIRVGEQFSSEWVQAEGLSIPVDAAQREFDNTLSLLPKVLGLYSPARPERDQRNVALCVPPIEQLEVAPPAGVRSFSGAWRAWHNQARGASAQVALFSKIGVAHQHCLRTVICEREFLLGWFGVYSARPFSAREQRLLARLIPSLQRRLKLEEDLRWLGHAAQVVGGLLRALPNAAFIIDGRGRIQDANAGGHAQLDGPGGRLLRSQLAGNLDALPDSTVRRLGPSFRLVTLCAAEPIDGREAAARSRWALTPRQAQVLAAMSVGKSNKAIALALGCSHGTVELHVSAVLAKLGVENRSAAVAKFWSELSR